MLSVDDATSAILEGAAVLGGERVALENLAGRVASADIKALITQPPFAASAMDGYAVRFEDAAKQARLKIIGEAPAGAVFSGAVGAGEAVRIFTGGVIPGGADHVVIQEDVICEGDDIIIADEQQRPRHIREAGVDFRKGDMLVRAGEIFHEIHGSILAAANIDAAPVISRPRVALFSNGDELMAPGAVLKAGQIINSNHYALCALVKSWGGEAVYLGCARDDKAEISAMFAKAHGADIVIPIGGASVGDYDFVKSAFTECGGDIVFEKIAMRPGKPTWFGTYDDARVIGLPGNPASALVAAILFAQPLVRRLAGRDIDDTAPFTKARLLAPLGANGAREAFLRGVMEQRSDGKFCVAPAASQDSSLLLPFLSANVLIRRKINAPALKAGDEVDIRAFARAGCVRDDMAPGSSF